LFLLPYAPSIVKHLLAVHNIIIQKDTKMTRDRNQQSKMFISKHLRLREANSKCLILIKVDLKISK